MPGLQARSPVGDMREATTHWRFSLSLSPSLCLSKNNKNLLKNYFWEVGLQKFFNLLCILFLEFKFKNSKQKYHFSSNPRQKHEYQLMFFPSCNLPDPGGKGVSTLPHLSSHLHAHSLGKQYCANSVDSSCCRGLKTKCTGDPGRQKNTPNSPHPGLWTLGTVSILFDCCHDDGDKRKGLGPPNMQSKIRPRSWELTSV